jgi:hypothetical protein
MNPLDLIICRALLLLLEIVYEGGSQFISGTILNKKELSSSFFLKCSHGFREARGCHTALIDISN